MFAKRKSAFSVYSENKPLEENLPPVNKNHNNKEIDNRKIHLLKNSNENTNINIHSSAKKKTEKLNKLKKEKKKFLKLASSDLKESISLFNGKSNHNQQHQVPQLQQKPQPPQLQQPNNQTKQPSKVNNSIKVTKIKQEGKKNMKEIVKPIKKIIIKKKLNPKIKTSKIRPAANQQLVYVTTCDDEDEESSNMAHQEDKIDDIDDEYDDNEMFDSRLEASNLLKSIISPVKPKDFFNTYWEKKPLLIKRPNRDYYKSWFSCKEFDRILKNNYLEFTTNIDVVTYVNEVKQKHNPEGRAYAPLVWDFFQQGCSIRFLNPQTYSKNCWKYLSLLQELFGTCVGANTYLTPAGTQGFAPHYDDIEAFVLQLEGKKRWRVYKPLSKEETLPKFSSRNYTQEEIGSPIIDVTLEAGDLLYFPRGWIHQANALDDIHSLHITVSCYQKNTWSDFLAKLLPAALDVATQSDLEFRRGLPINYLMNNGIAYDNEINKNKKEQIDFRNKTELLVKKLVKYLPINDAVDQLAKTYIHESLPPCLTSSEKARSIHGHGETWNPIKNKVDNIGEIEPDTSIKLIRHNCIRLVVENDGCNVYYNLDNSKVFCEKEINYLEVDSNAAPVIEFLIQSYPKYVTVEELPMNTIQEKIDVAASLYDKGLLVTGEPLQYYFDGESDEEENDEEFQEEYDDDDDDDENENGEFDSEDYDNFDKDDEEEVEYEESQETNEDEADNDSDDEEDEDEDENGGEEVQNGDENESELNEDEDDQEEEEDEDDENV